MPWWQQNPDEYFLGVKKRQPYAMPQQQRLPQIQPRQLIIKQINAPHIRQSTRVSQKTIVKPIFRNIQEAAKIGLGATERIASSGAKRIEKGAIETAQKTKASMRGIYQPRGIVEKLKFILKK